MMPSTLTLKVRFVQQSTGAFEHIVIFNATLEITDEPGVVDLLGVELDPRGEQDLDMQAQAVTRICAGIQTVLEPHGCGAQVRITGLLMHPVDFHPKYFETYTKQVLEAELQKHTNP